MIGRRRAAPGSSVAQVTVCTYTHLFVLVRYAYVQEATPDTRADYREAKRQRRDRGEARNAVQGVNVRGGWFVEAFTCGFTSYSRVSSKSLYIYTP